MHIDHQNQTKHPHRVALLGFDDVLLMDVAGPAQVFGSANKVLGWTAYVLETVTQDGRDFRSDTGLTLRSDTAFSRWKGSDDLIVPGGPGVDGRLEDPVLQRFLRRAAPEVRRFVSICSGSLLTAAAGLLTDRIATTHWERHDLALGRFADVAWRMDEIFTQDGKFHCSAGVTTGIDLALSLVEADHGRRVALSVAREMVVFMQRDGGQSQYSAPLKAQAVSSKRLGDLYARIEEDPAAAWTVQMMAQHAGTTARTLHRDFMRDVGQSPSRFLEERRLTIARHYLERSRKPIKEVAALSGFGSEQKMRRSFVNRIGILPTAYRARFGEA